MVKVVELQIDVNLHTKSISMVFFQLARSVCTPFIVVQNDQRVFLS